MIFVDTSALAKLVHLEPESEALLAWVDRRAEQLTGSELLAIELVRTARRVDVRTVPAARRLLASMALVPVDRGLIAVAGDLPDPHLRSLDAIYLASALSIRDDVTAFVVYDRHLAEAAAAQGFAVLAPGA